MFGYGSLMWRPGFEFVEQVPARLIGEHRALCVYSFVHRGTPEKPGLVLGLDRGGACRGIAFRVAEKNRAATVAYLREREQVTSVYREVKRSVWLENEARQRVSALAYVVDRGHVQYAGRLSLAEQLRHVLQGHGQSGVNRDYVLATVKAIEAEGFRDAPIASAGDDAARSARVHACRERISDRYIGRRIGWLRVARHPAEQFRLFLPLRREHGRSAHTSIAVRHRSMNSWRGHARHGSGIFKESRTGFTEHPA